MSDETAKHTREHLTESQIEGFRARSLSPDELVSVTAHAVDCESCRQRLAATLALELATKQMLDSLVSLPEMAEEHPDEEVRSAYIANLLDDVEREWVEEHLAACSSCRIEVEQLRSLLALVEDIPPPVYRPAASLLERIKDWLCIPAVRHSLQTAGFALAIGMVVFFVTRNLYRPGQQPNSSAIPARYSGEFLPDVGVKLATLQGDPGKIDPLPFALRAPLPGAIVLYDRVVFQWDSVRRKSPQGIEEVAKSYIVQLKSDGITLESPVLTVPKWQPEPQRLPRPGRTYSWKVFAYRDAHGREPFSLPDVTGQELPAQSPRWPVEIEFRTLDLARTQRIQTVPGASLSSDMVIAQDGVLMQSQQRQLRHEWLLKVDGRLRLLPNSTGANEMRAEIAKDLKDR